MKIQQMIDYLEEMKRNGVSEDAPVLLHVYSEKDGYHEKTLNIACNKENQIEHNYIMLITGLIAEDPVKEDTESIDDN